MKCMIIDCKSRMPLCSFNYNNNCKDNNYMFFDTKKEAMEYISMMRDC